MSADWPRVPLGEVLRLSLCPEDVSPEQSYPSFGVYGFGRGLFSKPPVSGAEISATKLYRVRAGQFVYSRLKAFEGAFGLVPGELDGCYVTNEFPAFDCLSDKLAPSYLDLYFRRPATWQEAARLSAGVGARRERLHPEEFASLAIPLPPLAEQRRIVARVEAVAARVAEVRRQQAESEKQLRQLLRARFWQLTEHAPRRPMAEVAPLIRRKVEVDIQSNYPELGIRSFAKGTFHKPPLSGAEVGSKKLYEIYPGDLVFNNVFAWEGAVAVALPQDAGRFGSHRFITCRPVEGMATAQFLFFHFQTEDGLNQLREASPGGAGRNRTLGLEALARIPAPVPPLELQQHFDALQTKADALRSLQSETAAELDALLPAVLAKAFAGEL